MPALGFLAVVGLALIALLFVADATLEPGSPPIVTSSRVGLPEQRHSDRVQILTTTPAPLPDMASRPVLAAQPNSGTEPFAKVMPAARAEVHNRPIRYRQNRLGDRFSIRGQ
jgi:hypothetical protein